MRSPRAINSSARWEPMKPAPPVIRTCCTCSGLTNAEANDLLAVDRSHRIARVDDDRRTSSDESVVHAAVWLHNYHAIDVVEQRGRQWHGSQVEGMARHEIG